MTPAITKEPTETITPLDSSHEIWNDRYEIVEKIGEGGQAVIYKAYDHLTNEEVAIKTMWSRHRGDRSAINRLKQGAMIARSLTHRYIIKTYSVEQRIDADGPGRFVFVSMELIRSRMELSDVIETRKAAGKKITVAETLHIIRQLLDALVYAHEYTIHRDIKPGNIMLVPRGDQAEADDSDLTKFDIRLIDFGIAKVLSQKHIDVTGQGFRSAHYGAPELADTKSRVDARADIYSAGVVMYQMLTLNIPRKGSPPANKVNKQVPAALATVTDKAMNADRNKRFKNTSEFIREIDRAVSKFRPLRKAAKIAAVLIGCGCAAGAIKYFMPEPDYGSVAQTIEVLESRVPDKQIASFTAEDMVRHSDIAGYDSYETLRKTALENLRIVKMAGSDQFNKKTFAPWKKQQDLWAELAPAVEKIERIAEYKHSYDARRQLAVVDQLAKMNPSSEIIAPARENLSKAETLLQKRPLSKDIVEICADSYSLGASLYTNIDAMATGSGSADAAERINSRLMDIGQLRNTFLATRDSLDSIEPLSDSDFHQQSGKCFEKADGFYRSFALPLAGKYFTLLNQICGTITHVRNQVELDNSDIALVSSRLMQLCYEDIETFENYPQWKQRLQQVYKREDFLARYRSIHMLLATGAKDTPQSVYKHVAASFEQYEQANIDAAATQLAQATDECKSFVRRKVKQMRRDCDSLTAFAFVSAQGITDCKNGLEGLSGPLEKTDWPQVDFIEQYNRHSTYITDQKNAVRQELIQQARRFKKEISDAAGKAKQYSFFWKSQLIDRYLTAGDQYDSADVDESIANWKYVDDLARLSAVLETMEEMNLRLGKMLSRKEILDTLSKDIDRGIDFCQKFRGTSDEERQKYRQFGSQLKDIRTELTTPRNRAYLIDRHDDLFDADYGEIKSAFDEIRAQLPYHRSRVIELINKTNALAKNADFMNRLRQGLAYLLSETKVSVVRAEFGTTRSYLESVKEQVDNWPDDRFNRDMRPRCKVISDALDEQFQAVALITSRVIEEKSNLLESVTAYRRTLDRIFSDSDIRELDALATEDTRQGLSEFKKLPAFLADAEHNLTSITLEPASVLLERIMSHFRPGFELEPWLEEFNRIESRLNNHISRLESVEHTISTFRQTREILAQQAAVKADYYLALRDSAVASLDYSDLIGRIEAVESDSVRVRMCRFLEQIGNNSLPRLEELKSSASAIGTDAALLKAAPVDTLLQVKDFNNKRRQLFNRVSTLQQELAKLDRPNLEKACRKGVARTVGQVEELIDTTGPVESLSRLTASLWSFFPDYSDWNEWNRFIELHHIVISGQEIRLTQSEHLKVVDEHATYLNLSRIAEDPHKAFYIGTSSAANFGWPRHLTHTKDPTVVFAFVPAANSSNAKPFYMARREITNSQYLLFLKQTGAKPTTKLKGWSYFSDRNNNLLIGQAQGQYPPCRIKWDNAAGRFTAEKGFENAPVTWVTAYGSKAYSNWLGGNLPTVGQHAYAARANAETSHIWGNDFSNISSYAHVRTAAWRDAAKQYNLKRDNPTEIAYPPVGAVKDFVREKALDPAKIVHPGNDSQPVWPCFTEGIKPNAWGLYDMIGNVWEWCTDTQNGSRPAICGGSCLSPPEYIRDNLKYEFDSQACDVGFRVVIAAQ